jgi:hypothetical protein
MGLLQALRPDQPVLASTARDGAALGAALLFGWPRRAGLSLKPAAAVDLDGLGAYALAWRRRVGG